MFKNLLKSLARRNSTKISFNPYQNKMILNNLRVYFEYLQQYKPRMLLIGEAPGYNGCRLTGIPFTSGDIINKGLHMMFKEIGGQINLSQVRAESTATMVWDFLGKDTNVPIFWNAFPFHPHQKANPRSNRKPNKVEIQEGKSYLEEICELFKPKLLCSLGRVGETSLKNVFPNKNVIYIRHPSYGGKKNFMKGMRLVLR